MSVRAMSLPRPATPLHDRPAPRRWTQIDPILLIVTVLLIGYGLVMTYSTTAETRTFTGDPMQFVIRGAVWAAIGMAAMAAIALFDYAWLGAFAPLLYVFTLGLLWVVLAVGTSSLGAQRSVNIAGLSFQFSEVAKVLMIIVLAKFFADRRASIGSPLTMLLGLALLAPPSSSCTASPTSVRVLCSSRSSSASRSWPARGSGSWSRSLRSRPRRSPSSGRFSRTTS